MNMVQRVALILGAIGLGGICSARAQVVIDVAKITCDQFVGYKVTNPQNIAIWIHGYYGGKRDNTMLDTQALSANSRKLQDYCLLNPQTPIMRAVDAMFGKAE